MPDQKTPSKIAVGRLGRPYGVLGWMHIQSFTNPASNILQYTHWQIQRQGQWEKLVVEACKKHGNGFIAKISTIHSPEFARHYTNEELYIERTELPPLPEDEVYLADLMGCEVINQHQTSLGFVEDILATGSNDVILAVNPQKKRTLIPYLDEVVLSIDLTEKKIHVCWPI